MNKFGSFYLLTMSILNGKAKLLLAGLTALIASVLLSSDTASATGASSTTGVSSTVGASSSTGASLITYW